jgi:hypothetical protein
MDLVNLKMTGPDDWLTIGEEKIVCQNYFCSSHATMDCEYVMATVTSKSLLKHVANDVYGMESVEKTLSGEVKNHDPLSTGELDDDNLNEA